MCMSKIYNSMYNSLSVQYCVVCRSSCITPVDSSSVSVRCVLLVELCSIMYTVSLSDGVYEMCEFFTFSCHLPVP